MSEAYRIKRFHHVTELKHRRLRQDKLIPLLDRLAAYHIMKDEIDDLLSTDEAMQLHMDDIDRLEDSLGIIQNLLEGDWLIDYRGDERPTYLMKFKKYSYQPHKHLFVKHFGEVSHVFEVKPVDLPEDVREPLLHAAHLETLPLSVSNMLDKYEVLALELEKQKEEAKKQEKVKAADTTKLRRGRPSKHGEVRVVKAATKSIPSNGRLVHPSSSSYVKVYKQLRADTSLMNVSRLMLEFYIKKSFRSGMNLDEWVLETKKILPKNRS